MAGGPKGYGIVRTVGWDDAHRVFRAIVEFPEGPPDLPFSVVMRATPVFIVIAPDNPSQEAAPTPSNPGLAATPSAVEPT